MIIAGLTGGIATGKSTVSAFLQKAGALIIDADRIARAVVAPGQPAHEEIRAHFGNAVLAPDGTIDRAALAEVVFNDLALRRRLEAIVHPRVGEQMAAEIAEISRQSPQALVVMDIPLLFESGASHDFAAVIVVYAPAEIQLQRLVARDRLTLQEARARIAAQMPIAEKVKRADIVIDNSGSLEETRRQTLAAADRLSRLRYVHNKR